MRGKNKEAQHHVETAQIIGRELIQVDLVSLPLIAEDKIYGNWGNIVRVAGILYMHFYCFSSLVAFHLQQQSVESGKIQKTALFGDADRRPERHSPVTTAQELEVQFIAALLDGIKAKTWTKSLRLHAETIHCAQPGRGQLGPTINDQIRRLTPAILAAAWATCTMVP